MTKTTDRIEKRIVLHAPHERVWRAISDANEFGTWFGVVFDGPFVAGARLKGRIVPTKVDAGVAKSQEPHEGTTFDLWVERIEPMRLLSFRWHPYELAPDADPSTQPATLVTFELEKVEGGIELRISESGFDRVPVALRAQAFERNEAGWEAQTLLIAKYLALPAKD